MEFNACPRLVDWRSGVSFPSLERLSVHYSLGGQMNEVTEICCRAPRLSALSLLVDRLRTKVWLSFLLIDSWVGLAVFHLKLSCLYSPFLPQRADSFFGFGLNFYSRLLTLFFPQCNEFRRLNLGNFLVTCFSHQCVRTMRGIFAIIGDQLRRLKIKIRFNAIRQPIMSALCGALVLERLEFEFSGDRRELTVYQLKKLITVRRSKRWSFALGCAMLSDLVCFYLNQAKWRTLRPHSTWKFWKILEFDDVLDPDGQLDSIEQHWIL